MIGTGPSSAVGAAVPATVSDVVHVIRTADGSGYLLVGRDGGAFAFGNSVFCGSLPSLSSPVDNVTGASGS